MFNLAIGEKPMSQAYKFIDLPIIEPGAIEYSV